MLFRISISVPYQQAEAAVECFERAEFDGICSFEDDASSPSEAMDDNGFPIASLFTVDAYSKSRPKRDEIATLLKNIHLVGDIIIEPVDDQDWLQLCYRNFPPQTIPPFFIYGSYDPTVSVPASLIGLQVDAATAFGSGEHQTTKGCLQLLAEIASQMPINQILDMGCGSGILAIAAAKLLEKPVIAVDIDPEAVIVTDRNIQQNHVENYITTFTSEGFANNLVATSAPYDLVLANILASPLIEMAPNMATVTHPGSRLILSGLLTRQRLDVVSAYESNGFQFIKDIVIDDWCALLLEKR